ncbi:MAG: hypothetical protein P8L44_06580 [Opitutales bacterium]|nr:hypothetical protein [Opitutales bacterium]
MEDSKSNYTRIVYQTNRPSVLTAEFGEVVLSVSDIEVKNRLRACINISTSADEFSRNTVFPLIEDTKVEIAPFFIKEYVDPDDEIGRVNVDVAAFQNRYRENSEFQDLLFRLYLNRRTSKSGFEYLLERVDILRDLLERKIAEAN